MRGVFADTGYWVAIIHPHDGLHQKAIDVSRRLGDHRIVTSEMVLVEVLNMFSGRGTHLREAASRAVQEITNDPTIEVVPQTRKLFLDALSLYRGRTDKEWSLTDCASFVIMKRLNIDEALTDDRHFEQNGFKALLKGRKDALLGRSRHDASLFVSTSRRADLLRHCSQREVPPTIQSRTGGHCRHVGTRCYAAGYGNLSRWKDEVSQYVIRYVAFRFDRH